MTGLKVVTLWVRPNEEAGLPNKALEFLLETFYQNFPEYEGGLVVLQAPRRPQGVFVYVSGLVGGLLPEAATYLRRLLERAFPQAEVRTYGRPWPATKG